MICHFSFHANIYIYNNLLFFQKHTTNLPSNGLEHNNNSSLCIKPGCQHSLALTAGTQKYVKIHTYWTA